MSKVAEPQPKVTRSPGVGTKNRVQQIYLLESLGLIDDLAQTAKAV